MSDARAARPSPSDARDSEGVADGPIRVDVGTRIRRDAAGPPRQARAKAETVSGSRIAAVVDFVF